MPALPDISDRLQSSVAALAQGATQVARHSNLYRAASFRMAHQRAMASEMYRMARFGNDILESQNDLDLDDNRPDIARKHQLGRLCWALQDRVSAFVWATTEHQTDNLAMLHELSRTRQLVFGARAPDQALSYARRASLKLHPDRTGHLAGWSMPDVVYAPDLGPRYRVDHAKKGAAGLFALHNGLKTLLGDPHYRRALYSPPVLKGGELTLRQAAADLSVATALGALVGVVGRKALLPLALYGALAWLLLLALYLRKRVQARAGGGVPASGDGPDSRALVLYRPPQNLKEQQNDTLAQPKRVLFRRLSVGAHVRNQ